MRFIEEKSDFNGLDCKFFESLIVVLKQFVYLTC